MYMRQTSATINLPASCTVQLTPPPTPATLMQAGMLVPNTPYTYFMRTGLTQGTCHCHELCCYIMYTL